MSKRSERRAAERASHKANRTVQAQAETPSPMETPNLFTPNQDKEDTFHPAMESESQPTASEAQINANRENAQHSTGPTTPEGKLAISQNRRNHGLLGRFILHSWENPADYHSLVESVHQEYAPQTDTELRLANSLIQHYWLMQRALLFQEENLADDKKLALYMRYQTLHERAYYKAQKELIHLQKERKKETIGFESQTRIQEAHEARTRLQHAKAQNMEIDTACRQVMEVPLPGHYNISFEQIAHACSTGISILVSQEQAKSAAKA